MPISTQWEHDPTMLDGRGMTVAMWLAINGNEIPIQW